MLGGGGAASGLSDPSLPGVLKTGRGCPERAAPARCIVGTAGLGRNTSTASHSATPQWDSTGVRQSSILSPNVEFLIKEGSGYLVLSLEVNFQKTNIDKLCRD